MLILEQAMAVRRLPHTTEDLDAFALSRGSHLHGTLLPAIDAEAAVKPQLPEARRDCAGQGSVRRTRRQAMNPSETTKKRNSSSAGWGIHSFSSRRICGGPCRVALIVAGWP